MLIPCAECGKEISSHSGPCPHCGCTRRAHNEIIKIREWKAKIGEKIWMERCGKRFLGCSSKEMEITGVGEVYYDEDGTMMIWIYGKCLECGDTHARRYST